MSFSRRHYDEDEDEYWLDEWSNSEYKFEI